METPVLSPALESAISEALGRPVDSTTYLASGAANHIFRVRCGQDTVVAKISKVNEPDLFACEAEGLRHMAATRTVHVPEVIAVSEHFLLMEDLGDEAKDLDDAGWRTFGAQLGAMHQVRHDTFGYTRDNYLGIWPQANPPTADWVDFYYTNRVHCYLDSGKNPQVLTAADRDGIYRLCERMRDLIPDQKPSLCHGDLWMNNIYRKASGRVYVFDPAIHFGLPEADLAMTQLYFFFPEAFYDGYREAHPLEADWKERLPLYQLKELLLMIAQFEHAESLATLRELIARYR